MTSTERIIKPPESRLLKSGRVTLNPGERMHPHTTEDREEILVILKGTATIVEGEKRSERGPKETHYIPEGTLHSIENNTDCDLEYIYVVGLFGDDKK